MVYSIYYIGTLVLPYRGGERTAVRDDCGMRTRDIIHIRHIGIGLYTKDIM